MLLMLPLVATLKMTPKKPSPFDTVNALSETRPLVYNDLMELGCSYDPFLINRAFSLHQDTVFVAALLNERSFLDKDVQATFLINTVRPRKRWAKWPKQSEDDKARIVADYYGMSLREAKLSVDLHTDEQIFEMKKLLDGQRTIRTNH